MLKENITYTTAKNLAESYENIGQIFSAISFYLLALENMKDLPKSEAIAFKIKVAELLVENFDELSLIRYRVQAGLIHRKLSCASISGTLKSPKKFLFLLKCIVQEKVFFGHRNPLF
jgi:hypothetical protein